MSMSVASPVIIDLEIQNGTPCFAGTRVTVKSLFDALEHGRSLEYFLEQFPTVSEEQAQRVLQQAEILIEQHAPSENTAETSYRLLESAILDAKSILDRLDEDGNPLVETLAFDRAVELLRRWAHLAWQSSRIKLHIPAILPGPDGSVDLHWTGKSSETLVNVHADTNLPISYYGDDTRGNSVKGNLVAEDNGGLVQWLITRQ